MWRLFVTVIFITEMCCSWASAEEDKKVKAIVIEAGSFTPLYGLGSQQKKVHVKTFKLDVHPVTKTQYASFVSSSPSWLKPNTSSLLADERYLEDWECNKDSCVQKGEAINSPVTYISWFAAQAYCEAAGGRLPSTHEWEFVGAASEKVKDAQRDPEFVDTLLAAYGRPLPQGDFPNVMQGRPNIYGVYDMHGLVWEWTNDFNSVFVAGDNRREQESMKNLFCGAGALSASDRANYAAYMRYAMRSSLRGSFALKNLGFRCAYDLK